VGENKVINPFWSVVTPTLQRESLIRCCDSIDSQSCRDTIEHIVMVDCAIRDEPLLEKIAHPQRRIMQCGPYRNFGNTPRHLAWQFATGTMIHYGDDDNYYADPNILEDMMNALISADMPDWACFPILRFGHVFFSEDPRCCHADTMNIVVKREIGRWPDRPEYTLDGIWIDTLRAHHDYIFKAFGSFRPIGIMDRQGKGEL
jgi:glycosyltransferase involved in cell wall biosynthesis